MFNVYNKKKGRGAAKTVFLIPVLGCLLGILLFLHVKFCHLRIYFRFCVKKFVVCLVVMGFCSTFALAFQRRGVRFSIKKAIFERIP